MSNSGKIYAPQFARIPDALKARRQWVVWKAIWQADKGKFSKVPYNARTGSKASTTDPLTWSEFDEACTAYKRNPRDADSTRAEMQFAGIGFVLAPVDQFAGVDLDHSIEGKIIKPEAKRWLNLLSSYAEISPSGTGLRVFVQATLPPGGRKKGDVEMYETARFLTVTGRQWPGTPSNIVSRQMEVGAMHKQIWPAPSPAELAARAAVRTVDINMSDEDLLSKAFTSKQGESIRALYGGDMSAYNGDHSSADLALCSKLSFWTGGDSARLDRWFRASSLMREKWDNPHFSSGETYGERTVRFALDGATEFYAPKGSPEARVKALSRTVAELAALPAARRGLPLTPSRETL